MRVHNWLTYCLKNSSNKQKYSKVKKIVKYWKWMKPFFLNEVTEVEIVWPQFTLYLTWESGNWEIWQKWSWQIEIYILLNEWQVMC